MSIRRVNTSFRLATLVAANGVITPNADLGNLFRHIATADVTLASPINGDEAQVLDVQVYASGAVRNLTAGGTSITIPADAWWWGRLSFDAGHDVWILDDGSGLPDGVGSGTLPVVAKGDLLVGTGLGTVVRLAVGTPGQVMISDPTTVSGIRWMSLAGTGYGLSSYGTSSYGS